MIIKAFRARLARATGRPDAGNITTILLVGVVAMVLVGMMAASALTSAARGTEQTTQVITAERVEDAIADVVAAMNGRQAVPATRAAATVRCQEVDGRDACYQAWAMPRPGRATDPIRYDLVVNAWVDGRGNRVMPADRSLVRAVQVSLEAITYQQGAGVDPVSSDGQIRYTATPFALFAYPVYGLGSATLAGPDVTVESYNPLTGDNGTGNGVVATSGLAIYGRDTDVDATTLHAARIIEGVTRSACTGESCTESPVNTVGYGYERHVSDDGRTVDRAKTRWVEDACAAAPHQYPGDLRTSTLPGGVLPTGDVCVRGAFIVDQVTKADATSRIFVLGSVRIQADLNAPAASSFAIPSRVQVYSAGGGVRFESRVTTAPGLQVAALIYAPAATCSTGTADRKAATDYSGQTAYYGALACDTVSLAGSWHHQYDDAALVDYREPVPGAGRAWVVGSPQVITTEAKWDEPTDWNVSSCRLPNPEQAGAYWKLSEFSGLNAANSVAGSPALGWASAAGGRSDGWVCGPGAKFTGSGQVSGEQVTPGTNGVSVEFWAGSKPVGTIARVAGVTVTGTSDAHIEVAAGSGRARFPFTVQNFEGWHHYVVTVEAAGRARLYVDGVIKHVETLTVGQPATSGAPSVLAAGSSGGVAEVVAYRRSLSASEVSARITAWHTGSEGRLVIPGAGVPFTAPGMPVDDGSGRTALRLTFPNSTGTLTPLGSVRAEHVVQYLDDATWREVGRKDAATSSPVSLELASPPLGTFVFRVCTSYNTDVRCGSQSAPITTLLAPGSAPVVTAARTSDTGVSFTWTNPSDAADAWVVALATTNAAGATSTTTSTVTGPTLAHTGAAGTRVTATVTPRNAAGPGPSGAASAALAPTPPTVTAVARSATSAEATLTGSTYPTHYELESRIDGGSWVAMPAATWQSGTTVSIAASADDQVEVRARTRNTWGTSAWSAVASVRLPLAGAPTISVSGVTTTSATITLSAVTGAKSYVIQHQLAGGTWTNVTRAASERTWTLPARPAGSTVLVRAYAVGNGGNGQTSATTTIYLVSDTPTITVTRVERTTARATWTKVEGAASYQTRHKVGTAAWTGWTGRASALTLDVAGAAGDRVWIQVRAINASGTAGDWAEGMVQLEPATPAPTASVGATSVTWTWPAVNGATGYEYLARVNGAAASWQTTTGRSVTVTARSGDKVEFSVRTSADGVLSPATGWLTEYTTIATASGGSFTGSSDHPSSYGRVEGLSCPAGTSIESRSHGRLTNTATTGGWTSWTAWETYGSTMTPKYALASSSYTSHRNFGIEVRCTNATTGRASGVRTFSGTVIHPLPKPTGVTIGTPEYRTAVWTGTCPSGLTERFTVTIKAAWGTKTFTNSTTTRYAHTADGWGSTTLKVEATCWVDRDPGANYSDAVTKTVSF